MGVKIKHKIIFISKSNLKAPSINSSTFIKYNIVFIYTYVIQIIEIVLNEWIKLKMYLQFLLAWNFFVVSIKPFGILLKKKVDIHNM